MRQQRRKGIGLFLAFVRDSGDLSIRSESISEASLSYGRWIWSWRVQKHEELHGYVACYVPTEYSRMGGVPTNCALNGYHCRFNETKGHRVPVRLLGHKFVNWWLGADLVPGSIIFGLTSRTHHE